MQALPANDLRRNLGTYAVANDVLPAVAQWLTSTLPPEKFDKDFRGQVLETTYFDTPTFALRKARVRGDKYLTLRVRCYQPGDVYALSAKTEQGKFRVEIASSVAEFYIGEGIPQPLGFDLLPPEMLARLLELLGDESLVPVVALTFRRYAVENDNDRFTLDCGIRSDTGKCFPTNVLEYKATVNGPVLPSPIGKDLSLRPIKLSKFLWATG